MTNANEMMQVLLDQMASGQLSRRQFMARALAAGVTAGLSAAMADQAFAAGDNQAASQAKLEGAYDYIVVGAGASGAIVAGELSKTGGKVLVVESGGADTAPTIINPSIWFYNVGGPLDWKLPIAPVPQLNNRKFNMALGHVSIRPSRNEHLRSAPALDRFTLQKRTEGAWRILAHGCSADATSEMICNILHTYAR